jgi:diguanylate cyclase (GGDEF)-like protein
VGGLNLEHAATLLAQLFVVSAAVVAALALRRQLGLTTVYLVIGALQALQTVAAATLRVPLTSTITVNPGSVIMFPGTLLVILLVYVLEDASETKRIIYGLLVSSTAVGLLLISLQMQQDALGVANAEQLGRAGRSLLVGTLVIWIDALTLILAFDATTRFGIRWPFLRAFLSLSVALVLDAALITTYVFSSNRWVAFLNNAVGKVIVAGLFSLVFVFVVREQRRLALATGPLSFADLFQALTWRDRYEMLEKAAVRDALTGVFNRAHFDREAQSHAERAALKGQTFYLLLIDLDDFKAINDTHGHAAGDRVLQVFGAALRAVARQNDTVCRYGGEEFAVLVAGTADAALVESLFERFCVEFQDRFAAADPPFGFPAPSFSMGAARFRDDGMNVALVLDAADRRLYRAKEAGKNRAIWSD